MPLTPGAACVAPLTRGRCLRQDGSRRFAAAATDDWAMDRNRCAACPEQCGNGHGERADRDLEQALLPVCAE